MPRPPRTPADPGFSGVPIEWDGKQFPLEARRRRHRRHHQLHEHEQPERDGRRRPACEEGGRKRPHRAAAREDEPRARLARRHRLLREGRPRHVPRKGRLLHGRLRLHDVHRQQRPAAGADFAGRQEERSRRRRRALRQSQFRRPHQSRREGELPGQPAARRRVRAGRHDRHRLRKRADRRRRQDGAPVYLRDIWPTHAEVQAVVDKCVLPEMFDEQYGDVWHKNPKWNAIETSEGELYEWDPDSTYIQEPPFLDRPARRSRGRSSRFAARAAWRRSATR